MDELTKQALLKRAPIFCRWCKDNDGVEWTEFIYTLGEKGYLVSGQTKGLNLGNSLSCECTHCGAIEEVRDD